MLKLNFHEKQSMYHFQPTHLMDWLWRLSTQLLLAVWRTTGTCNAQVGYQSYFETRGLGTSFPINAGIKKTSQRSSAILPMILRVILLII
jgi:hypothetical protein